MNNTSFIIINGATGISDLLNLSHVVSATRGPRLDTNSLRVIPDEYVVIVRTADGKEHRFSGAAGEALWKTLESRSLCISVVAAAAEEKC